MLLKKDLQNQFYSSLTKSETTAYHKYDFIPKGNGMFLQ